MEKPGHAPWKRLMPALAYWSLSGGTLLGLAAVSRYGTQALTQELGHLLLAILSGMLAGALIGAGGIALRLLPHGQDAVRQADGLVNNDSLTGLPNRTLLNDRLLHTIALAHRDDRHFGVFFFDLDHFKTVNDTQGHAVGDLVLQAVAQRLKKLIREGDTFARLGGDEFVIVQADPNHDPNFAMLARRILDSLRDPFRSGDRELRVTASIGVAVYPVDGRDPAALLQSADTAMYVAKQRGRNNFQFFSDEMNAQATAMVELEHGLRQALQANELQLYYQPQFDLHSGRIVAVEALLRWHDRSGRSIPPEQIVALAENSGLIHALGLWTIETAASQAAAWEAARLPALRIAVNLSGHHLRQASFVDQLEHILEVTGLPADRLEIELTESALMGHLEEILPTLTDLKVRGFRLAVDEFGTGCSSLLYLINLPIQRIKISPDFIVDISRNQDHETITETIIAMAQRLGLKVTAVGVENEQLLDLLRRKGCCEAAGNYLSPPLPAEAIAHLLGGIPSLAHPEVSN